MQYLKMFGYQWLEGSIRVDLDSAGRGVWGDILALASISRRVGYLERSPGIPYTDKELAEKFRVTMQLLQVTIGLCLQEGRLRQDGNGTYVVSNWDKYQDIPLGSQAEPKPKRIKEKPPLSEEAKDKMTIQRCVLKPELEHKAATINQETVVANKTGEILNPTGGDND